jgi:signal peptidase I
MLRFLVWTALIFGAIVGIARLTVLRWWRIPSDDPVLAASISPTLEPGDLVLSWRARQPPFGSMTVCPDPEDPARLVIGRIAGEPGDRIAIDGDNVRINDARADTEHACSEAVFIVVDPNTGNEVEQRCSVEAMGGVSHMRGNWLPGQTRQKHEVEVGQGKVFLLSDNRAYALDSRHYGTVDRDTCKESIFFRLVSRRGFMDEVARLTYIR